MRATRNVGLAGLLMLGALAGCGENPGGTGGGTGGTASVRLMNAAPGSTALDLVVGGKLAAGGIQYERASALASVPAGSQTLAVRPSGGQQVVATRTVELIPDGRYTVMVSGTGSALVLTSSVVVDTGLAKPDRANLRIINVPTVVIPQDSSQAPPPVPLNVYITPPGVSLSGLGSQLSLDARVSSYSSLLYFDPGTLVVRFVRPGTSEIVAETAPIVIQAGQVRAVTLQRLGDGSYQVSVVAEE